MYVVIVALHSYNYASDVCMHAVQQFLFRSEKDELKRKVGELEFELQKKVSGEHFLYMQVCSLPRTFEQDFERDVRRRSHAFGEFDSPKIPRNCFKRGRSSSMRSLSTALIIDIPDVLLRGNGFGSYHVFIVKVKHPYCTTDYQLRRTIIIIISTINILQ